MARVGVANKRGKLDLRLTDPEANELGELLGTPIDGKVRADLQDAFQPLEFDFHSINAPTSTQAKLALKKLLGRLKKAAGDIEPFTQPKIGSAEAGAVDLVRSKIGFDDTAFRLANGETLDRPLSVSDLHKLILQFHRAASEAYETPYLDRGPKHDVLRRVVWRVHSALVHNDIGVPGVTTDDEDLRRSPFWSGIIEIIDRMRLNGPDWDSDNTEWKSEQSALETVRDELASISKNEGISPP